MSPRTRPTLISVHLAVTVSLITLITLTHGYRLNSKLIDTPPFPADNAAAVPHQRLVDSGSGGHPAVGYVKASIPVTVFRCMQQASLLRCMKMFILQRMERTVSYANSGNVTADFLDQMLRDDDGEAGAAAALAKVFAGVTDAQLNERLLQTFRRFFRNREIKLYFLPGMVVKVVPSKENFLHFSVRKGKQQHTSERWSIWSHMKVNTRRLYLAKSARNKDLEIVEDDTVKDGIVGGTGLGGGLGVGHKNKHKTTEYLLQLGVPALMMPAILMGTVLPFLLPALKMATILSVLINNGALLTAAMYVAKQAAFSNEKIYYNAGYHRDLESWSK